jgi:Protein of unknown function (DUF551)
MEWIAVAQSVPKDDRIVLIFHNPYVDLGFHDDKKWCTEEYIEMDVTHWMPLPEPPTNLGQ